MLALLPFMTESYTRSLHDALPISPQSPGEFDRRLGCAPLARKPACQADCRRRGRQSRSEEHTSELQSHSELVCRLLLEKKNAEAVPSFVTGAMATDVKGFLDGTLQ